MKKVLSILGCLLLLNAYSQSLKREQSELDKPLILSEADLMEYKYSTTKGNTKVLTDSEAMQIAIQKERIARSDQNSFSQNVQGSFQNIDSKASNVLVENSGSENNLNNVVLWILGISIFLYLGYHIIIELKGRSKQLDSPITPDPATTLLGSSELSEIDQYDTGKIHSNIKKSELLYKDDKNIILKDIYQFFYEIKPFIEMLRPLLSADNTLEITKEGRILLYRDDLKEKMEFIKEDNEEILLKWEYKSNRYGMQYYNVILEDVAKNIREDPGLLFSMVMELDERSETVLNKTLSDELNIF
ncbi:MAG: hypothetical protein RSD53_09645 [Algoriella sp.]|uniref:hypothetical protein n=1 Tax=Algoriella sp. TaxID=1872434 RepID=UPI002FC83CB4